MGDSWRVDIIGEFPGEDLNCLLKNEHLTLGAFGGRLLARVGR
jgi:hypothetical protein